MPTPTNNAFTEAEQVYYDQFDEAVTAGRFQRLGHAHHRDDSAISDYELGATLHERPKAHPSCHPGRSGASSASEPSTPLRALPNRYQTVH